MARLINNRNYFDYNATSPLASSVLGWMKRGDVFFANSSSIHTSGKTAKRHLNDTKEYLLDLFGLTDSHDLFFHSGATEGINSLIKGFALRELMNGKRVNFFCATTDHSAVYNSKDEIEFSGHVVHTFEVNQSGDFDEKRLIQEINESKKSGPVILNYTYVNNETGVVWNLDSAIRIKKQTDCIIHVDAVQAPGKIENWWKLPSDIDAYTFSGHKFGALTGVGFSFIKPDFSFTPYMSGGGQQKGLRSGTTNTFGIYSIKLALEELKQNFKLKELQESKAYLEDSISKLIADKGEIVGVKAKSRNLNTIYFILYGKKADIVTTAFDLAGIDVSTGSACSSGAVEPSRILLNMGYSMDDAKSAVRLSFSSDLNLKDAKEYYKKVEEVVSRFL